MVNPSPIIGMSITLDLLSFLFMLPSEILQRRPDIVEAEERLKAANFEIGVARASYFPRIFLTGGIGFQSEELANLIKSSATFWNLGLSLVSPLLDLGRIKSEIEFKEVQKRKPFYNTLKLLKQLLKRFMKLFLI